MPTSARDPLLAVSGLSTGYGKIGVLNGVDLDDRRRRDRGAARAPTAPARRRCCGPSRACCPGPAESASPARTWPAPSPRDTVRAGLVHVIEGHRVFTQLTVDDNLLLAGYGMPRARALARRSRRRSPSSPRSPPSATTAAVTLSGGQQQMLAVAQGLVRRPRLLMLDEPSAGLSPVLVDRVLAAAAQLRDTGTAVLLVEQLIEKALALADRVYALARGSIVLEAPAKEPDLPSRLEHAYFGHDLAPGATVGVTSISSSPS